MICGELILTKKENHTPNTEKPDILTKHDKKVINSFVRDFGQLIILWILDKKRLYGNAIINKINNFYPDKDKKITGSSRIYPMLHDLEDRGLIEGTWESKGRQQIKYYEITDKGREEILRVKKLFKHHVDDELKDFMNEIMFDN
jgi:DNA-binding PadR family transcriptional regulator